MAANLTVLLRIEKAVFGCLSTYLHLTKRSITHNVMYNPLLVPAKLNLTNAQNVVANFGVLLRSEKAVFGCLSTHLHLTKRSITHRVMYNPLLYLPHTKSYQRSKTRRPILAFFCVSKRLYLGVLVHIYISRNGPLLTDICASLLLIPAT